MPFGTATVITSAGKAIQAKRMFGATPTQPPPIHCAMGTGATGAARTAVPADVILSTEVEARTAGTATTQTTTVTNDTFQVIGTVTASAPRNVDEAGLFDASSGGNMLISATFAPQALGIGDSIQFTYKLQYFP